MDKIKWQKCSECKKEVSHLTEGKCWKCWDKKYKDNEKRSLKESKTDSILEKIKGGK